MCEVFGSHLRYVLSFFHLLRFQTIDPLRAMAMGGPLEDARGLAQRYSRMRHEAEILVCTSGLILCCK